MAENTRPKDRKRLRYPLHNEDEYKARVKFTLVKEREVTSDTLRDLIPGANSAADLLQNLLPDITREEAEKSIGEHEGRSNQTASRQTIPVPDTVVSLYLPTALSFRDNVAYENFDLGIIGATLEQGGGILQAFSGGLSSLTESLKANSSAPIGDVAKLAATNLAGKTSVGDVVLGAAQERAKVVQGALRVTNNPNTRVFFKQVNLRDFAFTFKFLPRSREEMNEVKEIIKFFRTELYPEEIIFENISLGYRFPNKFRIEFYYGEKRIANKLKDCFLRDVSTTYNPTNMAMHPDGEFNEIDLTLAFQEVRALSRKDVEEDGF